MRTIVVIPSRYGSTRFPGKPLAMVAGVSMIQRVWALAKASSVVAEVYIATDDARIADHAQAFGGKVLMTPPECRNGTERVYAASQQLTEQADIIINLQGDALLTPPWYLTALAQAMQQNSDIAMATPAVPVSADELAELMAQKAKGIVGGTTVTFDHKGRALYFSKTIIPFVRTAGAGAPPVFRHIGIYAYTPKALAQYVALPEGRFEAVEQLEQLRALEHGLPIQVVLVDKRGRISWAIDSEADLPICERLIKEQGELLPTYNGTARLS